MHVAVGAGHWPNKLMTSCFVTVLFISDCADESRLGCNRKLGTCRLRLIPAASRLLAVVQRLSVSRSFLNIVQLPRAIRTGDICLISFSCVHRLSPRPGSVPEVSRQQAGKAQRAGDL